MCQRPRWARASPTSRGRPSSTADTTAWGPSRPSRPCRASADGGHQLAGHARDHSHRDANSTSSKSRPCRSSFAGSRSRRAAGRSASRELCRWRARSPGACPRRSAGRTAARRASKERHQRPPAAGIALGAGAPAPPPRSVQPASDRRTVPGHRRRGRTRTSPPPLEHLVQRAEHHVAHPAVHLVVFAPL